MKWIALVALILGFVTVFIAERWGSEDYGSVAFDATTIAFIFGMVLIFIAFVTFVVLIFNAI